MDDDTSNPLRRMSSRTRKVAPKMVAALASSDNRTQVFFLIPKINWKIISNNTQYVS